MSFPKAGVIIDKNQYTAINCARAHNLDLLID